MIEVSASMPQTPNHAEARAKLEADMVTAIETSFVDNAEHVQSLGDGSQQLTLYIEPRPSVIARVEVTRGTIDEHGARTTVMALTPVAEVRSGSLRGVSNGRVGANVWRLTESPVSAPRLESGQFDKDGAFVPFSDDLMTLDETVANFGRYWPANLRQGVPENPLRKSRGPSRFIGGVVIGHSLPPLQHRNYYSQN